MNGWCAAVGAQEAVQSVMFEPAAGRLQVAKIKSVGRPRQTPPGSQAGSLGSPAWLRGFLIHRMMAAPGAAAGA